MKLEHSLTSHTKINSKCIKGQNVRLDTIKFLEENIGRTLSDINHKISFFDLSPRTMEIKTKMNQWNLMKLKSFFRAKKTINKMKRKPTERKKVFANKATDKGLISNYTNNSCSCMKTT